MGNSSSNLAASSAASATKQCGATTPLTLLELNAKKGADGKPLKIVQKIAAHDYTTFGMYLLQDENGDEVALLKKNHIHDGAESVTQAILKKWLTSDAPTRTYQHLIECLRQSELGALAELIEKASGLCCSDVMSSVSEVDDYCIIDVMSKNTVSAVNDIASYASYLRRRYNDMSQTLTAQHWSHLPQCEYVQLTMIDCKRKRYEVEDEEKREALSLVGVVEPILDTELNPIEFDGLFSTGPLVVLPPPLPNPRVILVEAAPGGGKSTLILHICHQWAQGASFLERFDIVVLAYLRDGAIQDAKHLADILPADVLVSQKEIASEIIACRGKNILFIFDGWDEFPSKLRKSSIVSDIIRKSYKLPLDDCTILITSRSESSLDLHDIANRRVEILGFTRERIHEYVYKALVEHDGNDTRGHKLIEHLENHPIIIGSYCYVPLHAAILVHVFLTKNGVLPTTIHELFSEFLLCCVVRELKTHDKITFEVSSLEELPDDLQCKLNDLRVLAYKGVIQNKAVFYEKDLLEFKLPLTLKTFGLLQSIEGLTTSSRSVSYNFLHLSVQEHLAAYYISTMSPAEQVKVFKNLFQGQGQSLFQGQGQSRFQAVLQHYSGFTKLDNSEIQQFISTNSGSNSDILPLFHFFYEAQQPSLCKIFGPQFRNIVLSRCSSRPVDYLVIGYFISSILPTFDVCLNLGGTSDRNLELLLVELCKNKQGNYKGRLQLVSDVMYIGSKSINLLLAHLQQLPFLDNLVINGIEYHTVLPDSMRLQNNYCHLTKLQLSHCILPDPVQSITAMFHSTKLTHLNLSGTKISDEGACCVFRCLQDNDTLVNLNLSDIGIKLDTTAQELRSMLEINKTLTHLDLSSNYYFLLSSNRNGGNNIIARAVFQGLFHNTTLTHLNLSDMVIEKLEEILFRMLQVNKTLTHLDLSKNGNVGAGYLFKGLEHNTALVHLNLSRTRWAPTHGDHFFSNYQSELPVSEMLPVNKSLTHLDLSSEFCIVEHSLACMLRGLKHNTAIVSLNLSRCCKFTRATTSALNFATMLQANKTLTNLDLSGTSLSLFDQVSCIWEALMHNTTLTHLNLSSPELDNICTRLRLSDNSTELVSHFRCLRIQNEHKSLLRRNRRYDWTKFVFADQALSTMVQFNKTLTHLDLSDSYYFTDLGAQCVCQGLQHNTALLHLNLCLTRITDKGAEYIAQALHSNRALQTLDISYNDAITDDGFALIAESLKSNKILRTLYIEGCSVTPRLAKTVYQAKAIFEYNPEFHINDETQDHIAPIRPIRPSICNIQ